MAHRINTVNPHFEAMLERILAHRDTHRRLAKDLRAFELSLPSRIATGSAIESHVRQLVELSKRFLNAALYATSPDTPPLLLAAVEYFLDEDDADPDFSSYDGFEDDIAEFRLVASRLGRLDLLDGLSVAG